jgi:3',5'-cyclic AMP phosphodiesterase CpdA
MKNKKVWKVLLIILLIFSVVVIANYASYNRKFETSSSRDGQISPKYKAGNDLTLFVATDIHYLAETLRDNGQAFQKFVNEGDGKQLNYISEIMDAFVYDMKEKKPEVLIISGDLTNNGELKSHQELAEKLKEVEAQGTSVYVIPGNHDILNPWARGFKEEKQCWAETISPKEFSKVYKEYGYDEAVIRDETTLSYLAAPSEEVWLLMLDTSQYDNNKVFEFPQTDGEISPATLVWIKECIDLAKKNNVELIPVMHHNLLNHSEVIIDGYTLNNNDELLAVFEQNNLRLSLSGHIHIQDISSHKDIYDVATSSLAVYPQQYGILKYLPASKEYHYSSSWIDMEGWAKTVGLQDQNIIHFKDYSEAFFGGKAFEMAKRSLEKYPNYSFEERQQMAEIVRVLNLRYFEGNENIHSELILNSIGYKLWETAPVGFMKSYVKSISIDKDKEDNFLNIKLR